MSDVPVLAFDDLTYTRSQVDALSAGLAQTLAHRGVQAGQRVALMSSNRPEFVFAVQAIWQLGASAVLISPAWKTAEVGNALAVSGAQHAVGDNPVLAGLMPMLHLDEPITLIDAHRRAAGSRRRCGAGLQLWHHGLAQGGPPHPPVLRGGRAALARRPGDDGGRPHADRHPARRTSSACSTSPPCWTRAPGCGCTDGSTSTRCCSTSPTTGSPSRWRWRPSLWRSPRIRSWRLTTCPRCATSCGAQRR